MANLKRSRGLLAAAAASLIVAGCASHTASGPGLSCNSCKCANSCKSMHGCKHKHHHGKRHYKHWKNHY